MANAGEGPHVVQSPYDGFAGINDAPDVGERQHPLVYPMQMNHIGLCEFRQGTDIGTGIGYINGKKVVLLKTVGFPDDNPFPNELPYFPP